jgi:3-(methylthio)propanoyl-CoA dehydrogenase
MLLSMRAATEAMRALGYYAAGLIDRARRHPDPGERIAAQGRADLLIPIVKAWCSDMGVAVASTGVQVHGGMGYVEETGAAQHLRDARITPIYEGTNGIQANDLVGRKLARDRGAGMIALCREIDATAIALEHAQSTDLATIGAALYAGVEALDGATTVIVDAGPGLAAAGSTPYLQLSGVVCGGWLMARQALAAFRRLAGGDEDAAFLSAKIATARFYADHFLALAPGYLAGIRGSAAVLDFAVDRF